MYHEARGEPFQGQIAVALVTMNRQTAKKDICDVVYEPKQFSWTNHYRVGKFDFQAWEVSKAVATIALEHPDALGDFYATHYHTHKLRVSWSKKLKKVTRIGNHQFYK